MCLRFVFLLITRTASWLRLSRREEAWRIAEILILRDQLAAVGVHGHPVLGPLDRRQQLGRRLGDEASHQMIRTVTFLDLANPLLGRDRLTIGRGSDIAVPQCVPDRSALVIEGRQLSRQAAQPGLQHSARMMSDQAHQPPRHANRRQIARTIQGMETRGCQRWSVTDVVQPGRADQVAGLITDQRCEGCGTPSDTLHMAPAARQSSGEVPFGQAVSLLSIHDERKPKGKPTAGVLAESP